MALWKGLHNPLHGAGYCLDPDFHAHDHVACPEALTDFFTMCDKIHGEGSAESANLKAQLDWKCFYKAKKGTIFSRETIWKNAARMGPEEWYDMYVMPFHPELALVGMRVLLQVMLPRPVKETGLPIDTFTLVKFPGPLAGVSLPPPASRVTASTSCAGPAGSKTRRPSPGLLFRGPLPLSRRHSGAG